MDVQIYWTQNLLIKKLNYAVNPSGHQNFFFCKLKRNSWRKFRSQS